MKPRLFLLFNHDITPDQIRDAEASLQVRETVPLPDALKPVWAGIPPEPERISDLLEPVRNWLIDKARPADYVLIQGDFGACFLLVNFALQQGLIPIYATTQRIVEEHLTPEGFLKTTRLFKHQRFRRYEQE